MGKMNGNSIAVGIIGTVCWVIAFLMFLDANDFNEILFSIGAAITGLIFLVGPPI